jgi:hypothetical protein
VNRKLCAVIPLYALFTLLTATGCAQDADEAAVEVEAEAEADAAPAPDAMLETDAETAPAPDPDPDPEPDAEIENEPEPAPEPDPDPAPDAPRFADLYAALPSLQSCAGAYCHHPADAVDDTSADALWRWLTAPRVPSGLCADDPRPLIAPGDPEGSLLWAKVAPGVEVCGSKMPLTDRAGLSDADAERIRAWIAAGALP